MFGTMRVVKKGYRPAWYVLCRTLDDHYPQSVASIFLFIRIT